MDIDRVVKDCDLFVPKNPGRVAGRIVAVAALERVFLEYGEHILRRTLVLLSDAWNKQYDSYSSPLIIGIATLLHKDKDGAIKDDILSNKLSKSGSPGVFIGQTRDYAKVSGLSMPLSVREKALNIYKKRR